MEPTQSEEWRPVVGHEGLYEVSDQGQVRSLISRKVLRPGNRPSGHRHVMLCRPKRTGLLHHLVAEAFIGPRPTPVAEIRHLNGDAGDNRADNLRYGTRSENAEDSKLHGTHFHAGLTECKRGHDLTDPANLQKSPGNNKRTCLACRRERQTVYNTGSQLTKKGHCVNGHPMTPENRYTNGPRGTRCKVCVIEKRRTA